MQNDETKQQVIADYYDQSLRFYERWSGKKHGGYHFGVPLHLRDFLSKTQMVVNLSNMVIDKLGITSHTTNILDAGCGIGDVSRILRNRYPDTKLKIHGITLSPKQVEIGRRENEKQSAAIDLIQGDFEALPFSESTFDALFFVDSICYAEGEDKYKALREAARVLKSGGRLVIADVFFKKSPKDGNVLLRYANTKLNQTWKVGVWAVEDAFIKTAARSGLSLKEEHSLRWKIAPSVLHVPFFSFPLVALQSIRDKTLRSEAIALFRIGLFGTLVGMYPSFQYKLMVLEKR